jgi:hypothetical protein
MQGIIMGQPGDRLGWDPLVRLSLILVLAGGLCLSQEQGHLGWLTGMAEAAGTPTHSLTPPYFAFCLPVQNVTAVLKDTHVT